MSQDEIYRKFGPPNLKTILQGQAQSVWAFTNEDLTVLENLLETNCKKVFSLAASGDQAIIFLSKGAKINFLCDTRDIACFFTEFKFSALKNLSLKEFKQIFGLEKALNEESSIYWQKIRQGLSQTAAKFFDELFFRNNQIYQTFRKSKFFYKESWALVKKRGLPYINYFDDLKNINTPFIINSDIISSLKFTKDKFDLIYLANILDSKRYVSRPLDLLYTLPQYLNPQGKIIIVSQDLRKIKKFLKKTNYKIIKIIEPEETFLQLLRQGYPYFYLKISLS